MEKSVTLLARYDEACDYNFQDSKSSPGKVTGHFTQVVWKPTKEFGIGYATGVDKHDPDMKCVYVVARYKPAGNILGRFSASVRGRASGMDSTCSKKGNKLASWPDKGLGVNPSQEKQSEVVNSTGERVSSNVFPEQRLTKLYDSDDAMNMVGTDEAEDPQEKQFRLTEQTAEQYESDAENIGEPADVLHGDDKGVPLKQEFTPQAKITKLYDFNGNNMEVPSDAANEMLGGPTNGQGVISKQDPSVFEPEIDSSRNIEDMPLAQDTISASSVPSDTFRLTPSSDMSPGMFSKEDTATVKAPSATGASTSQTPPATSGKPSTASSGTPVVPLPSATVTKSATPVKAAKEECKECIVFITNNLLYCVSYIML